ncbi:MAG TPA: hypothetical protein PKA82_06295 [Pyrinomonadaceae bacterium]|nr:hypothetical protein [Pyrinomonadaceae bacterium]
MSDPKIDLLRHLVATIVFRGNVAIRDSDDSFANFKLSDDVRTPVEILAHIGDLLEGSRLLLKGEMRMLNSQPFPWNDEISRFLNAARELDSFLASESKFEIPIEKLVQGPIADALTHVGQLVILRRAAGDPITSEPYFQADIVAGRF